MIGLYSLAGQAVKKSGLPTGRKFINAGKRCVGVAVRGACLPYSVPIACIRTFGTTAGSLATYGLDAVCNIVSEVPLMGEGSVLADLSEEDLKEAYLQVGLDFQVSKWMWLELHQQDLIQRAEHASARRIQRWYRELKQRKQYEQNIAAKELRQQGKYLQAYLLQKVRNAEEHGRQQEQLLTATRQSYDQLEQQVQEQAQQLQEQRQHAAEESEMKSAQLAQQDAELATAKQELATRLAAHQDLERAAKIRSDQLQEQLAQRDTDLHAANAQCLKLHKDLTGKCAEVTAEKREQAALQRAHHARVKVAEDTSAQLQQQLACKATHLSSAQQELAHLRQELPQAHQSKHEAVKEAQKHSAQLQKQLDRKVTESGCLQNQLTSLRAELGRRTKAKEDGMEQMKSLRSQLRAASADRDDAIQELTERRNKLEGRAAKAQGRGQGLAARLAASGTSVQSGRSSGPSSPAKPPDEPKGRSSVFNRLSQVPAPTSQASSDQGSAHCGDVGVFYAQGKSDMPPGFGSRGGVGALDAPGESDMPPGFAHSRSASIGKGKGPMRLPNLDEVFGDSLPSVKQTVPKLLGLAKQLGKLHEDGLVHQAVHQHSVLVGQEGDWQFAELDKAAPKDSSLDKSMVYGGTEAPEMAQQQHKAGFYYPNSKQDMWAFGLLMFCVFKRMGQLPYDHQIAVQDGTTLLFASKLYGQARYTEWHHKIERTLRQQGKLNPELIRVVLGCLMKDPDQRFTAAKVVADLTEVIHMKGW